MALDIETALDWRGRTVVDRDGDKIGRFDELYLDDSDRPAWGAVTTGLLGMRQTFVPLSEARADGDVLQVPFGKAMVKDAPSIDPDAQLSPEEEDLLYRHYGLRAGGGDGAADTAVEADAPVAEPTRSDEGDGAEMIRSEEEVTVGTRRRVSGKARLKKYVVTEHVQKVVPVQREEVRVEFEPAEGGAESDEPAHER
ncbi:MAG: hypothetical protein QOH72_435 [Solirubrobacteraceae bacterium]|jgi:hypothetical protein|nr:hypothetical protein [Solirubrobacteraceae bacterium]